MKGFSRTAALRIALFTAAYYIAVEFASRLNSGRLPAVDAILAGSPLLLAAFLVTRRREWWRFAAAAVAARALAAAHGGFAPLPELLALSLSVPVTAVASLGLVRSGVRPPFASLRAIGTFLALSLTLLPLALVWSAALVVAESPDASGPLMFGASFLAGVLGLMLLTPALALALMQTESHREPSWRSYLELGVVAAGAATAAEIATPSSVVVIILPFVLWAAARLAVPGTATVLLAIAVVLASKTADSTGTFGVLTPMSALLVISAASLVLAAFAEQGRAARLALAAEVRHSRHQAAELSNIDRMLPIALAFLDEEMRVVGANEKFAALSQVPPPAHVGHRLREIVPALADRLEPLCREISRTGMPVSDAEIEEIPAEGSRPSRIWLARAHRVVDDDNRIHVSLALEDVTAHPRRAESGGPSLEKAATNGAQTEDTFFSTLAEHVAFALETDFVIVTQLDRPAGERQIERPAGDRVRGLASLIDGRPGDAVTGSLAGTLWESAAETDLWVGILPGTIYETLHPALQGVPIAGCLIASVRDSTSALCGFIAALSRDAFADIDAAAATLKVFGARVAAELERRRAEDEHGRLISKLGVSVRELTMLHNVMRIMQQDDRGTVSEWLEEVGAAVREQWPVPGVSSVRISLGPNLTASSALDERQWCQRAVFLVSDGQVGTIEIAYDTRVATGRSTLLDAIAEMLRTAIERRQVIVALRQSEERYRSVVEHQSDLVCRFLADTTLTFVNQAYCRYFGKDRAALIGLRFIALIPEGERDATLKHIATLLRGEPPQMYEHAVLRPDGTWGRHQWINYPILSSEGRIEEFQGIGRDITDRWRAEEALRGKEARLHDAYQRIRSLAQRLILAQEAERTEIARDLHDDISQQLAALAIELSMIESRLNERQDLSPRIAALRQLSCELADKVRRTSHTLHPGVLKHAGLAAALASHCDTVRAQHAIVVSFEPQGHFDDVAVDLALCVYRVAQQALRNVVMHAHATRATVTLARHDGTIELVVADDGQGFDPTKAHGQGIGLMSIEERVSLAHGTLRVDSSQGSGSRLRIEVPVCPPE